MRPRARLEPDPFAGHVVGNGLDHVLVLGPLRHERERGVAEEDLAFEIGAHLVLAISPRRDPPRARRRAPDRRAVYARLIGRDLRNPERVKVAGSERVKRLQLGAIDAIEQALRENQRGRRLGAPAVGRGGREVMTTSPWPRKRALLAQFGADIALPDLLLALASYDRRQDFSRPCGARFTDLAQSKS